MLLLSFSLAVLAAALSWQEGGWLFLVPGFVAFSALWDLVLRWRFQTKVNTLIFSEGADDNDALFIKEVARARWRPRLFVTPVYFLIALGSLLAGWIWGQ